MPMQLEPSPLSRSMKAYSVVILLMNFLLAFVAPVPIDTLGDCARQCVAEYCSQMGEASTCLCNREVPSQVTTCVALNCDSDPLWWLDCDEDDPTTPVDDPTTSSDDPTMAIDDPPTPSDDPETPSDDPTTPSDNPTMSIDDPPTPSDDPTTPCDDPPTTSDDPTTPSDDSTSHLEPTSTRTSRPSSTSSQPEGNGNDPGGFNKKQTIATVVGTVFGGISAMAVIVGCIKGLS
ncbi:hypothetical protein FRB91_001531 [Serendipita sp. 411]|nr:hypothetical protein FRB91_001531 [Serendipita sp. 411]